MYFQILEFYLSIVHKKKKVQFIALQGLSKNIRISIQLWKWMPTLVKKKCTQKIDIIFKNSSFFVCFIWRPQFFIVELFFGLFYHAFRDVFYFSSFSILFVYLCLFVNDGRSFYFFYLGYGHGKHKSYKYLVFMFIYGGLIFKV
jgi:hypothetical protein